MTVYNLGRSGFFTERLTERLKRGDHHNKRRANDPDWQGAQKGRGNQNVLSLAVKIKDGKPVMVVPCRQKDSLQDRAVLRDILKTYGFSPIDVFSQDGIEEVTQQTDIQSGQSGDVRFASVLKEVARPFIGYGHEQPNPMISRDFYQALLALTFRYHNKMNLIKSFGDPFARRAGDDQDYAKLYRGLPYDELGREKPALHIAVVFGKGNGDYNPYGFRVRIDDAAREPDSRMKAFFHNPTDRAFSSGLLNDWINSEGRKHLDTILVCKPKWHWGDIRVITFGPEHLTPSGVEHFALEGKLVKIPT